MAKEWKGDILALDIATKLGWAEGEPGGTPRFGSLALAPDGSSQAAIFGGMIGFLGSRLQAFKPRTIVFEAPELFRLRSGKATRATIEVLFGLPAVMQGVAYRMGVYDLQEATAPDVRGFFIGQRNLKRQEAKKAVVAECHRRGWMVRNDDEGDACALWAFMCAYKVPELRTASPATPLFGRAS
ncbi:hypothetical protein [Mesorhizobium sp. M2A.F.Ca.ET.039.01.1.1]|uniref:hypothetical protein n=1 Tax=Mesorhizobium sp. M2A.F.Ca.ET.039.01.1.1 TaxID=2496746 RepID=UPI000FCAB3C1|nr:hypothetical protein [Mesorhizobium sp. M2A.F.Ca.ET.039.01.1.1]RWX72546.1 hypothetical protein EOA24_00710 [Mesorhizobium sp. M2A.F.Ca.ET.039.01.1.1]